MRFALLILVVLAGLGALFVLKWTESPSAVETRLVVEAPGAAADPSPLDDARSVGGPVELLEPLGPGRDIGRDDASGKAAPDALGEAGAGLEAPNIRWGELVVLGRLTVQGTDEPGALYTVALVPTGTRLRGEGLPAGAQFAQADTQGRFILEELEIPGPWDVYALSRALGESEPRLQSSMRVGFARARNPEDAEEYEFYLTQGLQVILTAPLPAGVAAKDLWLEARWEGGRGAALTANDPCARRGFVRGSLDVEGRVVARLPHVSRTRLGGATGLRVFSDDGRFGLGLMLPGSLPAGGPLEIAAPLRPRASLRVQLEFEGEASGEATSADWRAAARGIEWKLLLGDPEREGLPKGLRTTPENRCWRSLGNGVFELGDLPVGALEVGQVSRDVGSTRLKRGDIVVTTLKRVQATHPPAPPVPLNVRRVR